MYVTTPCAADTVNFKQFSSQTLSCLDDVMICKNDATASSVWHCLGSGTVCLLGIYLDESGLV